MFSHDQMGICGHGYSRCYSRDKFLIEGRSHCELGQAFTNSAGRGVAFLVIVEMTKEAVFRRDSIPKRELAKSFEE